MVEMETLGWWEELPTGCSRLGEEELLVSRELSQAG